MLFSDGTELVTENVGINAMNDKMLEVSFMTTFDDIANVKSLFSDKEKTKVITDDFNEYRGFTHLAKFFIVSTDNDNMNVIACLEYEGIGVTIEELNSQVEMLTECLLEMSELLYN